MGMLILELQKKKEREKERKSQLVNRYLIVDMHDEVKRCIARGCVNKLNHNEDDG